MKEKHELLLLNCKQFKIEFGQSLFDINKFIIIQENIFSFTLFSKTPGVCVS